jgi:hypothetical protein
MFAGISQRMTRPAVRTHSPGAPPPTRRLLATLAVLAFFLQSLAVQTHIHPARPALPGTVTAASGSSLPGPLNSPDLDQGCRLCQEIAHAGAYITPAVALPVLMLALASGPLFRGVTSQPRAAPGFAWQSRGPPAA